MKKLLLFLTLLITINASIISKVNFELIRYSYIGDVSKVKDIVENKKASDLSINQALIKAGYKNRTDVIKYLITLGADINHKSFTGKNILSYAVQNENLPLIKYLLGKGVQPIESYAGWDIYFTAVLDGNIDIVKYIFSDKIDLEKKYLIKGEFGREVKTTLLITAIQNNHLDVARFLLTLDTDVDNPNSRGETPLLTAMRNGYFDMANEIILKNANLGSVDDAGNSLFTYALKSHQTKLALKAIDDDEFYIYRWIDSTVFNDKPEIYEYYISKVDSKSKNYSLLHMSSWHGESTVVEKLLSQGLEYAVMDKVDRLHLDALGFAVWNGNLETAKLLIEKGSNPYLVYTNMNPEGHLGLYYFGGLSSKYTLLSLATISQNTNIKLIKYLMNLSQANKYAQLESNYFYINLLSFSSQISNKSIYHHVLTFLNNNDFKNKNELTIKYSKALPKNIENIENIENKIDQSNEEELERSIENKNLKSILYHTRGDDTKLLRIVQALVKDMDMNEQDFLSKYFDDRETNVNKTVVKEFVQLGLAFQTLKDVYLLYSNNSFSFILNDAIFKENILKLHQNSDLIDIAIKVYHNKRRTHSRIETMFELIYKYKLQFDFKRFQKEIKKDDKYMQKLVDIYDI